MEIETVKEREQMSGLKSSVPDLLVETGWSVRTFVAHCMLAGIGMDTAYRVARGGTNVKAQTMAAIAKILDVPSISDIIDIDGSDEQQGD